MAILGFKLSKNFFVRNPQYAEWGRKIVQKSIKMIDRPGFDDVTFRKLATEIDSMEASVYRYFANKHRMFIYLIDWCRPWLEHPIALHANNIQAPAGPLRFFFRKPPGQSFGARLAYVGEATLLRTVSAVPEKTFLTCSSSMIQKTSPEVK